MAKINITKRRKVYQYQFEIAPIDGKRKFINKSDFRTKAEAEKAGIIAYNEYMNMGHNFTPSTMSYSDYLDYWMKEYFEINYKYTPTKRYSEAFESIKKELGKYRLAYLTSYVLNQALLKIAQK